MTPLQWHQNPSHPILDGFTIRRTGDTPTKIRLILHLLQHPEQFRVLPDLGRKSTSIRTSSHRIISFAGNILGIKEESRAGVIQTLWTYIKTNNLQDKVDRKRIHADAALRPVRMQQIVASHMRLRACFLDIWRRNHPIPFLTRASQSVSRTAKSRGHQLYSESIYATLRSALSLGHRT